MQNLSLAARDAVRQLAQASASTGLDGGVELPGRFPVLWVGALYHIKLYRHYFLLLIVNRFFRKRLASYLSRMAKILFRKNHVVNFQAQQFC